MAEETGKKENQAAQQNQTQQPEQKEAQVAEQDTFFDTEVDSLDIPGNGGGKTPEIGKRTLELLYDLELPISVELARKEMEIRDILTLGEGSIVEFDKMAGDSVDILVNNKKIAEGEVVVIDDRFGVRITSLIDPSERLKRISATE